MALTLAAAPMFAAAPVVVVTVATSAPEVAAEAVATRAEVAVALVSKCPP
jgi:hypothetical protein